MPSHTLNLPLSLLSGLEILAFEVVVLLLLRLLLMPRETEQRRQVANLLNRCLLSLALSLFRSTVSLREPCCALLLSFGFASRRRRRHLVLLSCPFIPRQQILSLSLSQLLLPLLLMPHSAAGGMQAGSRSASSNDSSSRSSSKNTYLLL